MANQWQSWIQRWRSRTYKSTMIGTRLDGDTDWLVPNVDAFSQPDGIGERKEVFRSWIEAAFGITLEECQWDAIVSTHAVALVNAGAGSGKTATMTLRLLALNVLYDVPYNEIHVFTFNVTAAKEFRQRFVEYRTAWDKFRGLEARSEQYQNEAESCITTFNSAFYGLRRLIQQSDEIESSTFDFLDKTPPTTPLVGVPEEDTGSPTKISGLQREVLRSAHAIALTNPEYRQAFIVHKKYRPKVPPANPRTDPQYMKTVEQWMQTLKAISKEAVQTRRSSEVQSVIRWLQDQHYEMAVDDASCEFSMSALHNSLDRQSVAHSPVVVQRRHLHWSDRYQETIQRYATNYLDHYWLTPEMFRSGRLTDGAAEQLRQYLDRNVTPVNVKIQEGLGYIIQGDASAYPAYEDFWKDSIAFFFSLGRDPAELAERIATPDSPYRLHALLLQYYIPALRETLKDNSLILQGDLDAQLLAALENGNAEPLVDRLMGYRHIIVDEFQDINPVLVRALRAILRIQRPNHPSIMAVGDDWQSIYSWRGSNPEYLVHFSKYFSNPVPQTYQLTRCFRCSEPILTAAATIIQKIPTEPVARRTDKIAQSWTAWNDIAGSTTLHLIESTAAVSEIADAVHQIIKEARPTVTQIGAGPVKIQCLFVTNDALWDWKRHGMRSWKNAFPESCNILEPLTIHRAKGLQADIVIIIGALSVKPVDSIREAAWDSEDFVPRYADIQRDEPYRVGYVAVTRARWGVIWIPKTNGITSAPSPMSAYSQFAVAVNAVRQRATIGSDQRQKDAHTIS